MLASTPIVPAHLDVNPMLVGLHCIVIDLSPDYQPTSSATVLPLFTLILSATLPQVLAPPGISLYTLES
jgi:hypothetical protein